MARIAAEFAEAESVPVSLFGDYLQVLMAVAETGRRLTRGELEACCQQGEEAAGLGVPLRVVGRGVRALAGMHREFPDSASGETKELSDAWNSRPGPAGHKSA
jgi:hypothetical protein